VKVSQAQGGTIAFGAVVANTTAEEVRDL